MYYHVISKLFEESPSAFYHSDIKTLLGLSSNKNDLRAPYQINSSNYIESNIDSPSKFRRLRILLNKLGYEEELLINFSDLEPDEVEGEIADRSYWTAKAPDGILKILDQCLIVLNSVDRDLALNYSQRYIGIAQKGKANNFIIFIPKQNFVWTSVRINDIAYWVSQLTSNNYKILSVGKQGKRFKFRITSNNIQNNRAILDKLLQAAYSEWMN
jgi:hypothetical protein